VASRDLDVDVLCALERLPFVAEVLARDDVGADAVRFAVVLRPFTIRQLVEAHYALLVATSHDVTGRVLYVDADGYAPPMLARMRSLAASPTERDAAHGRAIERARDASWIARLEEAAVARTTMEDGLLRQVAGDAPLRPIVSSMQSGVFEIVPDPFPSPKIPMRRILVADEEPATAAAIRELPRVEVTEVCDGWAALDALTSTDRAPFDLALCAVALGEWSGAKLYRTVAQTRPEAAGRIVFVAGRAAVDGVPPSVGRARVLARPIDLDAVRQLLEHWRPSRG
jgi:CheY-like chemotaxis protein